MARPGRRTRWALFACSLAVGTALSAVAQGSDPLRFNWPVPCRVGVSSMVTRDSLSIVLHYTIHVYPTPHPDELKLQFEDAQVLDVTVGGRRIPGGNAAIAQLMAITANRPPITLSRGGNFVRSSMGEDMVAAIAEWLQRTSGKALDPANRSAMERLFRSPEMKAQVEADDRGTWDSWVGSWVGLHLQPGEFGETTALLPVIDGPLFEGPVRIENLGPAAENPRLTILHLTSTTEGDAFREAVERNLRAIARLAGAGEPPPGRLLALARRTYDVAAILDPTTLRPNFVASGMQLELGLPNGQGSEQFAYEECRFEWDTPLAGDGKVEPVPKEALDLFNKGDVEGAYTGFKRATARGARNPDTFAYLAESARRLDGPGEAVLAARRALALSPRHAFAHCVLSDAYDFKAGGWPGANEDSSWVHMLLAVECDSSDGNAWMGVVLEAKRRNRLDLEQRSLTRLSQSGFITPSVLAYARWIVRDLPDSAVLLTNGDMDTYPIWVNQAIDRLRPDIAVVNYSLLNLPWYARHVRDRLRVPITHSDAALDALLTEWRASEGQAATPAKEIVKGWLDLQRSGSFGRPLAFAVTVPVESLPAESASRLMLVGPAWICTADTVRSDVNVDVLAKSLASIRAADFQGPFFSERDRSPVRRGAAALSTNIVAAWIRYAQVQFEAGNKRAALKSLDGAEEFARKTGSAEAYQSSIEELRRLAGGK